MSKKPKPLKMVRLTIQFADTAANRKSIDKIQSQALKLEVQGLHGTIKKEHVSIVDLHVGIHNKPTKVEP